MGLNVSYYKFLFLTMIHKQMWRSVNTLSNTSSKPSPRWGHSNCVIGEEVVLFGGYADSIYMNDLWTFNTRSMVWTEVQTTGAVPSHRSNCSLNYDAFNNRVVMFGGGGSNKARYNSINVLDWDTKVWTEIAPKENEAAPWQRTYHTAELSYPYLVVFGGEGVADLDDLWAYNFQTSKWTEIVIEKGAVKPCARRFHSSCMIGNQFFVIAGCHTKYRCLNDIYSIDLTKLIGNGSVEDMEWKERKIIGYAFLTRWGHTCSAYENKIYIFGGRFSNDLNDLLVFDPSKNQLKCMKVAPETIPKPRRRPSTCFIGSCLLMFGGFNQDYYNDLHYINVGISSAKPKKKTDKNYNISKFINNVEVSDIAISTKNNQPFYCHRGFIRNIFHTEEKMNDFLESLESSKTKQELSQIMQQLYEGYGSVPEICTFGYLPATEQKKQEIFLRKLEQIRQNSENCNNIFMKAVKKIKLFNNFIASINDDHYSDFLEQNRQKLLKDTTVIVNNFHKLDICSPILRSRSHFFDNILSSKFHRNQKHIIYLDIPSNVVLFEILVNFMMYNYLIVPDSMSWHSWIELYTLADYLALSNVKQVITHYLETLITEASVADIFAFSQNEHIEHLSLICAQFEIKNTLNFEKNIKNKYISKAFEMSKFELKQKLIETSNVMLFKKKKSSDSVETEGEKENYEVANS